jgi:hypothetical protein
MEIPQGMAYDFLHYVRISTVYGYCNKPEYEKNDRGEIR